VSVRLRVDGWPHVNGYAGTTAAARYQEYRPFQGSKESSKIWLEPHNDGREKMRFLRHLPCPPRPLLPSTAGSMRTKAPTTSGMMSRFQLRTRAHPCRTAAPTAVTHIARAPPTASGHGQQKMARRNHRSWHHSSTALTVYAHVMLLSTQSWSKTNSGIQQSAVNKRISKGRKTNLNSNVLFEVRIFELRITSLVLSSFVAICHRQK